MSSIFVTIDAAEHLESQAMETGFDRSSRAFRLGVALPRGVAVVPDDITDDDVVIRYRDRPPLILGRVVAETLEDSLIDLIEGRLIIEQGKATCGGRGCFEFLLDSWTPPPVKLE